MSKIKLGKIAITPKGEYASGTIYERLDCVKYNGSSWLVLQRCSGVTPTEGAFYTCLAEKGDKGEQGLSAYELWLAQGHKGTEAEFVASLSYQPDLAQTDPTATDFVKHSEGYGYVVKEAGLTATNTLTWDGNIEGKEYNKVVLDGYGTIYSVKVSDSVCSVDDLIGGTMVASDGTTSELTIENVVDMSAEGMPIIAVNETEAQIVLEDYTDAGGTRTRGVWLLRFDSADGSSIYGTSLTAVTDCFVVETPAEIERFDKRLMSVPEELEEAAKAEWHATTSIEEVDIVPEQNVEIRDATPWYSGQNDSPIWIDPLSLENGRIYKVLFDGVIYDVKAVVYAANGIAYIGNYALMSSDMPNTGEPFVYIVRTEGDIDGGYPVMLVSPDARGKTVTFRLFEEEVIYNKLPHEHLPNGLGCIIKEGGAPVEIFPETSIEFSEDSMTGIEGQSIPLEAGKTYIVKWNGVEYSTVPTDASAENGLPAGTMMALGDVSTPFMIVSVRPSQDADITEQIMIIALDGTANTTITVSVVESNEAEIQKIDNRLLDLEWFATKPTIPETPIWNNVSLELSYVSAQSAAQTVLYPNIDANTVNENYFELGVGKTYSVTWGGTKYENLVAVDPGVSGISAAIGDLSSVGGSGAGIPFSIMSMSEEVLAISTPASGDMTVTVSIAEVGEPEYDTIPEEYLPETLLATIADLTARLAALESAGATE